MTENNAPFPARRRFLNKATYGACTTTALVSVPELWVRPVVQSVILPAHAESSPITTARPNSCTDSVTIDATDYVCSDSATWTIITFALIDNCITVSSIQTINLPSLDPTSISANQLGFGMVSNFQQSFNIEIATATTSIFTTQNCDTNPISHVANNILFPGIEVSGQSYQAALDVIRVGGTQPPSLTISDIAVTRIP